MADSDHLDRAKPRFRPPTVKVRKRPALLGEVTDGGTLASTCLYPALFSTRGFRWVHRVFCLSVASSAQSPHNAVWVMQRGTDATLPCKSPHRVRVGAQNVGGGSCFACFLLVGGVLPLPEAIRLKYAGSRPCFGAHSVLLATLTVLLPFFLAQRRSEADNQRLF